MRSTSAFLGSPLKYAEKYQYLENLYDLKGFSQFFIQKCFG